VSPIALDDGLVRVTGAPQRVVGQEVRKELAAVSELQKMGKSLP
jgi:hypothetical protein